MNLDKFIQRNGLPDDVSDSAERCYLPFAEWLDERQSLSHSVHPLLSTRGVPGTHDVVLGVSIIERLRTLQQDETVKVPRFDKSRDDRYPLLSRVVTV